MGARSYRIWPDLLIKGKYKHLSNAHIGRIFQSNTWIGNMILLT